jgi:hypothetical protein
MGKVRKALVALAILGGVLFGLSGVASADQPGPGDKQCVPGHQGNPHPGFKAGVC